MAFDTLFLATPNGVALIIKNQAPMEVAQKVAKCHPEFLGDIFDNFEEIIERLQNSHWWLLFLSTVIFHPNFYKNTEKQKGK